MPDHRAASRSRALSGARLLWIRSAARAGLLGSTAATVAVAVATVCLALAWLSHAVAIAGDPPPPGVDPDEVAAQVADGAAALASAAPALVILVALLAGTAVAQLARLVAAAREYETATIRARGFSRAQAWWTDAAEGAVVALAGTAIGFVLAIGAAPLVGAVPSDTLASWPWAAGTGLLLAVTFAIALRRGEGRSSRGTRATTAALVVVLLLASALVVWQLPLSRGAGFDPIVAIAPAVVLMAGAVAALAVFGAAAVAWARPAAVAPALEPGYPARQVARRIPIFAVAVLLVALTVAQAVFTAAYTATWTAMTTDSAAVVAGADLRVDTEPQTVSPADVADAAAVPDIVAAAPALVADVESGSLDDLQLVSTPASAIDPVVTSAGGLVDKAALAATADEADGVVSPALQDLGDAATGVRVTLAVDGSATAADSIVLTAVLVDAQGTPTALTMPGARIEGPAGGVGYVAEVGLPQGGAPWRLLGLLLGSAPSAASPNLGVAITALEAVGGEALDVSGEAELRGGTTAAVLWVGDGGAFASGAAGADALPVAASVTTALAERLGAGIGDELEFRYTGTGRRGVAVITSIVEVVPGASAPRALFVPLEQLLVSQLQRGTSIVPPGSVWAAGAPETDDALSAALGDRPVATSAPGLTAGVVGALVPGWWIATVGSAVLALIAALAIVQTLAIARRREVGVLRALGVTPRRQARMRAAELGGVFAAAVVLGGAAGALVALLIVPALVRAVTPGILPAAGGVDMSWLLLSIAVACVVVGLAVIVAAAAGGVRRVARTATVGEESR